MPATTEQYERMRVDAFLAMSRLATRMTDVKHSARWAPPGSAVRVQLADMRCRMDDLRVAFSVAVAGGQLDHINRNGYRIAVRA